MVYTVEQIRSIASPIAQAYGVKSLSLFGSYARGEATDDSDIDLLTGEVVESHTDSHLEERQIQLVEQIPVLTHKVNHRLLRYHSSVDAYPLTEINEVWRGVEPHLVACLLQDGGEEVGYRPLAVGAGNMDATELALRMAESLHHVESGLYVGLIGSSADAVIHRQLCKHEI